MKQKWHQLRRFQRVQLASSRPNSPGCGGPGLEPHHVVMKLVSESFTVTQPLSLTEKPAAQGSLGLTGSVRQPLTVL